MSSTRKLSSRLTQLLELFNRNDDWLIVINADPDAMASAMALKRIMSHRTGKVTIARINEISRPDNLAMIRYLRIPMLPLTDKLKASYSHFAMVDSQPHHNPAFAGIPFSIVIDHHPAVPEHPVDAAYVDIRPQYGAVSTLLTEYLRAYHIRPGIRLATALQYGIRTDTATFTRTGTEIDLRAYQYLAAHGDTALLTRITRSEYFPEWLKYFARAFSWIRWRTPIYSWWLRISLRMFTASSGSAFAACTTILSLSSSGATGMSILANSPPHVLVRSVMRAGTAPSRVPNFPLRRPKAAASMCSSSASSPKSPKRRKLKTLRVWRGERKSRVWIWNRGREPFKKGSLPPPLSLLNFSIVLNPCLRRSHFARGQGVAFFLGSRRAAEQSCSAALHMKRLDTIR